MRRLNKQQIEDIRNTLRGLEVYFSEEDLRKLYDSSPHFQHKSFEEFTLWMLEIKRILDENPIWSNVR